MLLQALSKTNWVRMLVGSSVALSLVAPYAQASTIYGEDSRREVADGPYLNLAGGVGIMLRGRDLYRGELGVQLNGRTLETAFKKNLCPDVAFAHQKSNGFCTAFMVGPDIAMTASHCFSGGHWKGRNVFLDKGEDRQEPSLQSTLLTEAPEQRCQDTYMILGLDQERSASGRFDKSEVLRCQKIIHFDHILDFAIFKVDNATSVYLPLQYQPQHFEVNKDIFSLGYPMGLPLKSADQAKIQRVESDYFFGDLDMFYISSGSPIMDASSRKVMGIMIGGDADFIEDKERDCYHEYHCESDCAYEKFLRLDVLWSTLPDHVKQLIRLSP